MRLNFRKDRQGSIKNLPKLPLIIVAVLSGFLGAYLLIHSFAATPVNNCFATPSSCGYPDATNSGVPANILNTLTPSGSITASTPGQVINAKDVAGTIEIDANNVTIQNTRVTLNFEDPDCTQPKTNTCGNYEIRINEGVTGTIIKNSELRVASGITCEHDIRNASSGTLQIIGDYLHGCDSNLYNVGNATMTDTYGLANHGLADPLISTDHIENIYFDDSTMTVNHSTLFNPVGQTAVVFGNTNGGEDGKACKNNLTVSNSLFAGGGFTIYPCAHANGAGTSKTSVTNTRFARCLTSPVFHPDGGDTTCQSGADIHGYYPQSGDYGVATDYFDNAIWTGNIWDDNGQAICADSNDGCAGSGDTTLPTVSVTAPTSGKTVSGSSVTVSADASDNVGVVGVQFQLDGNNLGSEDTSSPYSTAWNTTGVSNGTHTLTAIARDATGNTKTSVSVTVTVNNSTAGGSGNCTTTVSSAAAAQSAVSSASAGQTICLSDGSYGDLSLTGNKTNPGVTLQAQNPGKTTVGAVSINGSGLTFSNFNTTGEITIQPGSSNIVILHNKITGGYFGVDACSSTTTTCNDVKIIGNKFQGPYGEDAIRANRYHDTDGDGFGLTVSQNEITGVRENGNHSDCLQTVWVGDGIDFDHNYEHDNRCQGFFIKDQNSLCGSGIDGVCGTVKNVKIYDNIFTRNNEPCAASAPDCGQPTTIQLFGPEDGVSIDRNTMWGGDLVLTLRDPGWSNVKVTNNAVSRKWTDTSAPFNGTYSSSNNLFCNTTYSGSWPDTGFTSNCNPAFPGPTAAGGDDFRLGGSQGVDWAPSQYTYGPTANTDSGGSGGDTTPPAVSFTSPANGATVSGIVTANITASDNVGVTKVDISLDGSLKSPDTSSPYIYSFDSKTLTDGSHTLSAKAYDAAGNTKTVTITVMVDNPDTTAPSAPTSLTGTATSPTTVKLTWNASTDSGTGATGIARYDVLRNEAVIGHSTTTSYTDNTAVSGISYNYNLVAVDGAENASAYSNTFTVKMPTAPDKIAPSVPTGLNATAISINQINLSWKASTDTGGSGLAGYNIYRSGQKINNSPVTTTSYGDNTVSAGKSYSYKIESIDGAGNKSAQTAAVTATTPVAIKGDVTGPGGAPDGKIDLSDVSFIIRNYNTNNAQADISGPNGQPDGKVDIYDLSYIIRNYGK